MRKTVLPNGLTVVTDFIPGSQVVSVLSAVQVGSIDEVEPYFGIAHFTEHMIFKGTSKRQGIQIDHDAELLGADFNAYTTFESTTYDIIVLQEHLNKVLEIKMDALFNSTFPAAEIETERDVILQEIKRYQDSPSSLVGQKVFELAFARTPYSKPILGTVASVKAINQAALLEFHARNYVPANITIYAAGATNHEEIVSCLINLVGEKYQPAPVKPRIVTESFPKQQIISLVPTEHSESRIEITFPSFAADELQSPLLDLGIHALTAMDDSPLPKIMRDQDQIVSQIGGSVFSAANRAIASISLLPYPGKEQQALDSLQALLRQACESADFGDLITKTKALFNADRVRNTTTAEARSRQMAHADVCARGIGHEAWYFAVIEEASPNAVLAALREVFLAHAPLIVVAHDKKGTIAELTWSAPLSKGQTHNLPPVAGASIDQTELIPGVKFIYQFSPEEKQFSLVAATEGGQRVETAADAGKQFFIGSLLGKANDQLDFLSLGSLFDGHGAYLEGFAGKDSLGLSINCLSKDALKLLPQWISCLQTPIFPQQQLDVLKKQCEQSASFEKDDAGYSALKLLRKKLYQDNGYAFSPYGDESSFGALTVAGLTEHFAAYRDGGPWVISAVGSIPYEEVVAALQPLVASWRPTKNSRAIEFAPERIAGERLHVELQREQVHVIMGTLGSSWLDKSRYPADIISAILGGSAGRLFQRVRGEEGLVYSVSPMISHACMPGILGIHAATSPENVERLLETIQLECDRLRNEPIGEEELLRAINQIKLSHALQYESPDSRAFTMALMELYGLGYQDYDLYLDRVSALTPRDLQDFAMEALDTRRWAVVTAGAKASS